MYTPSVTVVIPALNEEDFIERCLTAVKCLDYPQKLLKVIVADNGSTDKTREIALQYTAAVLDVPRKSIAHTRNVGAEQSTSDIIAFIDADIVVHPSWLAKAAPHFLDENVVAVGSYPDVLPGEANRLQQTWSALCRSNFKKPTPSDWLPSANLIVRRAAFKTINGFNEDLITCEDSDLGYRIKTVGTIINDPNILVYHLREPKTFVEFFKKEVWHSAGNLTGAFNHGFKLSELPSLILPALFSIGILICMTSVFFGKTIFGIGCLSAALPLFLYVGKGRRKTGNIGYISCIYFVYLAARSYSLARDVFRLMSFTLFKS
jgi:cellulose synthase/poly-beta-1,6-N-acetylglucosamine synthase-like glycosyltransferase